MLDLDTTPHTPVAIIGAGACGLTAALMLHDLGIDCVLIERDSTPSGSTALSSGFIPAAGTKAQQAAGIADGAAQFALDIQGKAKGYAAAHLVEAYSHAIAPALDALEAKHGVPWQVLDGFLYPGHSTRRMHATPEKTGAGLMARLLAAQERAQIPLLTDARLTQIFVDETSGDGKQVTGIAYTRPDGSVEMLRCDALLLACNGFGGNTALVQQYIPEMADAIYAGHSGNDGTAITLGTKLGVALADMGAYQGHGSWAVPHGVLISWALMMNGGVQLNSQGQRFHDEQQGYSEAAVGVLAQPKGIAWNVFDERILQTARAFPDFVEAEKMGAIKRCEDASAIAALIGCESVEVPSTLIAPFYAVRVTGALFHTQGGLDIDSQCLVQTTSGEALQGLWAAGGAARGVSGHAVWGYLSGNGLLSAVAGGYIAAHSIAESISK
jgi:fumarate reductase flavoprotein subunit